MSYSKEYRKRRGDSARVSDDLISWGKKLLAELANRMRISGVTTLRARKDFADGSVVIAAFFNGQPIVDYILPDVAEEQPKPTACSMRMESGLLELGADASEQPAEFAAPDPELPIVLYPGDTSRVQGQVLTSELRVYAGVDGHTLLAAVASAESRISEACDASKDRGLDVTTADKVLAQVRFKGSMWTGLMRRYIQAIFGSPAAAYKFDFVDLLEYLPTVAYGDFLHVPALESTEDAPKMYALSAVYSSWTTGIIDPDKSYRYWFVRASSTGAELRPAVPSNDCGKMLLQAFQAGRILPEAEEQMEAFLLSSLLPDMRPEAAVQLTFTVPVVGVPISYGWKFNARGSEIAMVAHRAGAVNDFSFGSTQVVRKQFVYVSDVLTVVDDDDAAVNMTGPGRSDYPGAVMVPAFDGTPQLERYLGYGGPLPVNQSWDAPIYAYYITDDTETPPLRESLLEVVRVKHTVLSVTTATASPCGDNVGFKTILKKYPRQRDFVEAPERKCEFSEGSVKHFLSAGYYTPRFSSVRVSELYVYGSTEYSWSQPATHYYAQVINLSYSGVSWVLDIGDGPLDVGCSGNHTVGGVASGGVPDSNAYKISTDMVPSYIACQSVSFPSGVLQYWTRSYTWPPTKPVIGHPELTATLWAGSAHYASFRTHTSRFMMTQDYSRWTFDEVCAKMSNLIIPYGDASVCAIREYDADIQSNTTAYGEWVNQQPYYYYSAGVHSPQDTVKETITHDIQSRTSASNYVYQQSYNDQYDESTNPPTETVTQVNGSMSVSDAYLGAVGDVGYAYLDLWYSTDPGPGQIFWQDEGLTRWDMQAESGQMAGRGTWLLPDAVVTSPSYSGSIFSTTGDLGPTPTTPGCGSPPALVTTGTDAPLLVTGQYQVGFYYWGHEVNNGAPLDITVVQCVTSVGGANWHYVDIVVLPIPTAQSCFTADKDYPVVFNPSFVGWA